MRGRLSIHTYITALVVGTILPFLVFGGLLVDRSAMDQEELIASTVRTAAQGAAADVDRLVSGLQTQLLALSDSAIAADRRSGGFSSPGHQGRATPGPDSSVV